MPARRGRANDEPVPAGAGGAAWTATVAGTVLLAVPGSWEVPATMSPGGQRVGTARPRIGGQASGQVDTAGGAGPQGAGAGQGGAVAAPAGCAAGGVHAGIVQPAQQAELHGHPVRGLGRRRVGHGHRGVEGAADRAAPAPGAKGDGAVADAPAGSARASATNDRDSGRYPAGQPGAGAEAGQVAGGAAVLPDLAAGAAALAGEVDKQWHAGGLAGAGLQAVADAVHQDAVGGQRPLLGLDGRVAGLEQDGGAVSGGLPAQVRVPDRVDLHGTDGGAAARGRGDPPTSKYARTVTAVSQRTPRIAHGTPCHA